MNFTLLWIPATLAAAAAQTARNATQRQLTDSIGTVGASQVRFLYGFPFALLFLAVVRVGTELVGMVLVVVGVALLLLGQQ